MPKYKGYSNPVEIKNISDYYTAPTDGILVLSASNNGTAGDKIIFVDIVTTGGVVLTVTCGYVHTAWDSAECVIPVFKGQKMQVTHSSYLNQGKALYFPYYL